MYNKRIIKSKKQVNVRLFIGKMRFPHRRDPS